MVGFIIAKSEENPFIVFLDKLECTFNGGNFRKLFRI